MTKVISLSEFKRIGERANRYNFTSSTLSATCFYDDRHQGYILIIDNGKGRNLFTNFSVEERLAIHEVRKVFKIYGFKIDEHIFKKIEKESSITQVANKHFFEVGNIDSSEFE